MDSISMVMLSRWAHPLRSRPGIARLLDMVTALPSVRRNYAQQAITDEIC